MHIRRPPRDGGRTHHQHRDRPARAEPAQRRFGPEYLTYVFCDPQCGRLTIGVPLFLLSASYTLTHALSDRYSRLPPGNFSRAVGNPPQAGGTSTSHRGFPNTSVDLMVAARLR